jgi:Holliday junction resolvase RusA-like endonuclease
VNEDNNNSTVPIADVESNPGNAPDGEKKAPSFNTRVNITVISYRKRKHDTDGISAKAAIDGLVHAQILKDDSRDEVEEVRFKSIKCAKDEAEKTIIIIESV